MIKIVPNWAIALIAALLFAITFGYGRHTGYDKRDLEVQTERVVALEQAAVREKNLRIELETERNRLSTVSGKLQEALQNNEGVGNEVTKTITREVEKPVYRDTHLPASGVQVLSDSARQFNDLRSTKNR